MAIVLIEFPEKYQFTKEFKIEAKQTHTKNENTAFTGENKVILFIFKM